MSQALKELLTAKAAFVKSRIDSHQIPTPAQLGSFLREMTLGVAPIIPHCPYEVTRLLKKGYAYVGWDPIANKGVCKTPPTAAKVLDFLTKAKDKIETYENGLAADTHPTPGELEDMSAAATKLWYPIDSETFTLDSGLSA